MGKTNKISWPPHIPQPSKYINLYLVTTFVVTKIQIMATTKIMSSTKCKETERFAKTEAQTRAIQFVCVCLFMCVRLQICPTQHVPTTCKRNSSNKTKQFYFDNSNIITKIKTTERSNSNTKPLSTV